MTRRARLLLLSIAALLAAGPTHAADPIAQGPCGPVARPFDVVEIASPFIRRLNRVPIDRFVLVARRGTRIAPIPLQIDERRGRRIASTGGIEPDDDDQPGIMDPDDAIVFMACDAGERIEAASIPGALPGATVTAWREIQLEDRLTGASAWAYLLVADAPRSSTARYATYDATFDRVTTAAYRVGCVRALPVDFALVGGNGPNVLDGIRLRADAILAGNLARWQLTERGGGHALIGWKEGPVRVVRRSRHTVKLGLGIEISAGYASTYFYPRHVYGPGAMKLPVSPSMFFREITAFAGVDMLDLRGWRYHAPGTPPEGYRVDGRFDDTERALAGIGSWFVLENGATGLLVLLTMSENLARAVPLELAYLDDAATPYPPELVPGTVPLVGWRAKHLERLPPDKYKFQLRIFLLDAYRRGDEHRVLAALDSPLGIAVNGPGLPVVAPVVRR